MKIKQLAFALGLGFCVASSAHALTLDLGTVPANISLSQVIQKSSGSFTDKWVFDIVGSPVWAGGSVSNLSISLPPLSIYNIDMLSVQLYDNTNHLIQDLDLTPGSTSQIKVGSGVFPVANDYYFTISGNANGMFGGQYVFAVTTLPVPEPETWAMLVAGLGLVGLQLRRRTNTGKISIN